MLIIVLTIRTDTKAVTVSTQFEMYDEIPGKNDNSVQTMLCNKMYAFGTSCGQQMWHAEYWVQNKNKNYHFILVQQVISLNCKQ